MTIRRLLFAILLVAGCDSGPAGPDADVTPPHFERLFALQRDSIEVGGVVFDSVGVVRVQYSYRGSEYTLPIRPDTLVEFAFREARSEEDGEMVVEACDAAGNCTPVRMVVSEPLPVETWARGVRAGDTLVVREDTLTLGFVARSRRGVDRMRIQRDFEPEQTLSFVGDTVATASLQLAVPPGITRFTVTMDRKGGGRAFGRVVVRRVGLRFGSVAPECAVGREDGLLYCWFPRLASNAYDEGRLTPVFLPTTSPAVQVARGVDGGTSAGCVLVQEGSVYCWTEASAGRGGVTVTRVPAEQAFTRIVAGPDLGCALTVIGEPYCWSMPAYGSVGPASPVATSLRFQRLTAGSGFTCGITMAGDAACWGLNTEGQLGDGSRISRDSPVVVAGGLKFVDVSAGRAHTCAISTEKLAYCWGGTNPLGQIGGTPSNSAVRITTPRLVSPDLQFERVAVGATSSCGLALDGEIHCWGDNSSGQLGVGTSPGLSGIPLPVKSAERFRDLAAAGAHTCAATLDHRVACWGSSYGGPLQPRFATPLFPVGQ